MFLVDSVKVVKTKQKMESLFEVFGIERSFEPDVVRGRCLGKHRIWQSMQSGNPKFN